MEELQNGENDHIFNEWEEINGHIEALKLPEIDIDKFSKENQAVIKFMQKEVANLRMKLNNKNGLPY